MVDDEFATYSALLRLSHCGFAPDEFTVRFLPGKGFYCLSPYDGCNPTGG